MFVRDALKQRNVEVEVIDAVSGLPDMTFTGDAGMVFNGKYLASNFRHQQRQGEVAPFSKWLTEHGYREYSVDGNVFFEGLGDIVYFEDDIIFAGGLRSSLDSAKYVRDVYPELNFRGELELVHDSFYHAGLCIAPLSKDLVLYYGPAFSAESISEIEGEYKYAIAVSDEDAYEHVICNNILVDQEIFAYGCSAELEKQLKGFGFDIFRCNMSEFMKSGGSVRCLILDI